MLPTERSLKDTPEIRARIHLNQYLKFWGEVGSTVYFRSGPNRGKKRDKIPWTVKHIEMNPENVTWSKDGKVPNYIKLEGEIRGTKQTIWTCQTQLINTGVKK